MTPTCLQPLPVRLAAAARRWVGVCCQCLMPLEFSTVLHDWRRAAAELHGPRSAPALRSPVSS